MSGSVQRVELPWRTRTRVAVGVYCLGGGMALCAMGARMHEGSLLAQLADGGVITAVQVMSHGYLHEFLYHLAWVSVAAMYLALHLHLRQESALLRELHLEQITHASERGLTGMLIPGIFLWRGWQVQVELWQGSRARAEDLLPTGWRSRPVPRILGVAWGCFALAVVMLSAGAVLRASDPSVDMLGWAAVLSAMAHACTLVAAGVWVWFALRVEEHLQAAYQYRAGFPTMANLLGHVPRSGTRQQHVNMVH